MENLDCTKREFSLFFSILRQLFVFRERRSSIVRFSVRDDIELSRRENSRLQKQSFRFHTKTKDLSSRVQDFSTVIRNISTKIKILAPEFKINSAELMTSKSAVISASELKITAPKNARYRTGKN